MSEWKYYHYAMIPVTAPNKTPDLTPVRNKAIFREEGGKALLVRWTSNYDCKEKTDWWYCVLDRPLKLEELKSKRRYEINKGIKNFNVRKIDFELYREEIYQIQTEALKAYPKRCRPRIHKKLFVKEMDEWKKYTVLGAFLKDSGKLCGYSLVEEKHGYANLSVLKTIPEYERIGINAALIYGVTNYYKNALEKGCFLIDGERSIFHVTAFQDYLQKYFQFRKAYCYLHIVYRPGVKILVNFLFPFRGSLKKLDSMGIIHQINGVMAMEEIHRRQMKI